MIAEAKIAVRLPGTELLIAFLSRIARANDFRVIGYAELSEIAHEDVRTRITMLNTARRRVQAECNRVFDCVPGVGIKLLNDRESSALGERGIRHIRRHARRTRRKMECAIFDRLTDAEKRQHMASDAVLGLTEKASKAITQKRIEASIQQAGPTSFEAKEILRIAGIRQID